VLAFDDDKVVGASTAIPMQYETDELKKPFLEQGYDLAQVFYCSESVLNKNYRGLGIGVRFFEEREAHAAALGGFKHISFCCVERPVDHPRRPANYMPWMPFGINVAMSNILNYKLAMFGKIWMTQKKHLNR